LRDQSPQQTVSPAGIQQEIFSLAEALMSLTGWKLRVEVQPQA
jgi:hypothetical protein